MQITAFGHYAPAKPITTFQVPSPIFPPNEKIIAFDIDGVLLLQKPRYFLGLRIKPDRYQEHHQAKDVFLSALKNFDRVVLWTRTLDSLNQIKNIYPFSESHLSLVGAFEVDYAAIKNLRVLSSNLENVIAVEDSDTTFDPLQRVVNTYAHESLFIAYNEALRKVNNGKSKAQARKA